MTRLARIVAAILTITFLPLTARPVLAARTLQVDDDKAQCRTAQFTRIQDAVNAASPGDTVEVCPGFYLETVVVPKTLLLKGRGPDPRSRSGAVTQESVLTGVFVTGFQLQADSIQLQGFTIRDTPGPGVYTSPLFSGYQILGNLFLSNVFGLYLNSSGVKETLVKNNAFRSNNVAGSASGNGIYSDQGLAKARIEANDFTGNGNYDILITAVPLVSTPQPRDLVIQFNRMTNSGGGILLGFTSFSRVNQNRIASPDGTGIFLGDAVRFVALTGNTVEDGQFSGIALAPDLGTGTPPTDNSLLSNNVRRNGRNGIGLINADRNLLKGNTSERNGIDGILADADSMDNRIEQNRMSGNAEHDCHDDSVGARNPPALVANEWIRNAGQTQNRAGLCPNARVV